VAWWRKAAEQGHANAQNLVGVSYATGDGVPKDTIQALAWYTKSAEQGLADAQYNLGMKYWTGDGVPRDFVTAYMWFNLAAAQGSQGGKGSNGSQILRDDLEKEMTPAQIAEAQKLSREWKPKK
jgi:TPR repeat protein